jgi:predicted RNA-binding Zn-ribbon protein involved in translation (DUF1610 family)
MENMATSFGTYVDRADALEILNKLIESEGEKIMKTNDCVSREKVAYMITNGKYANENYEQFIDRLIKELKNLPPVISTRKVGKWKQEYIGCMYDVCSECGTKVTKGFFKYNYCPNCGTKMKTKSESGEK